MESRKYQLQKQIIKAIESSDNDLYALLKSQWAHRYGVESLEELNNLDLKQVNLDLDKEFYQENDQTQDNLTEKNEVSSLEDPNSLAYEQEKQIIEDKKKTDESGDINPPSTFENKPYIAMKKEVFGNKSQEIKSLPKVKALIPIPPKPKYGYLKKWIRN